MLRAMVDSEKIGVVAGVGPFAGVDLLRKIAEQTQAAQDQEHLTVLSISQPSAVADRTAFLLSGLGPNPGLAIGEQLQHLQSMGATVAGIPCNTAHAPAIYNQILTLLPAGLKLLHMIEEVATFMHRNHPHIVRVGILSTTGTRKTQIYPNCLDPAGFETLLPAMAIQEDLIQPAIDDTDYGIKALGINAPRAREQLLQGFEDLRSQGAQAVVLGCTEIPLVIRDRHIQDVVIIDPTLILARALIRTVDPTRLRPLA
jgi:aspartate racemase